MMKDVAFGPMDGADGADGADGFATLDALGSVRQAVFRPLGVAPEFKIRTGETDYRGHRWPPLLDDGAHQWPPKVEPWQRVSTAYPLRLQDFTPDNASLLIVSELVDVKTSAGVVADWKGLLDFSAGPTNDMTRDIASQRLGPLSGLDAEFAQLRLLMQYRSGVIDEAIAQKNGIIGYFRTYGANSPSYQGPSRLDRSSCARFERNGWWPNTLDEAPELDVVTLRVAKNYDSVVEARVNGPPKLDRT